MGINKKGLGIQIRFAKLLFVMSTNQSKVHLNFATECQKWGFMRGLGQERSTLLATKDPLFGFCSAHPQKINTVKCFAVMI